MSSAEEFDDDTIVRQRPDRPMQGWRKTIYSASGGWLNPGVGPIEQAHQEIMHRIRRPLSGSHQIAVGSIKGGVGKTTVASCLGLVLAEHRGDRVVALDANPDAGTLADRLTGETDVTVRQMLAEIERIQSWADVSRYTSLANRLQVLASEQDPAMSEAFSRAEYEQICTVLRRFYNILITDSGTGLVHSAMEGTLALADSLIIVGALTVDGASRASKTLDWLVAHGHASLVGDAVVVLSGDRVSREIDQERVRDHFLNRCRAVVDVPYDPHLATGGRIELNRLRRPASEAFLELAALMADRFVFAPAPPGAAPEVAPPNVEAARAAPGTEARSQPDRAERRPSAPVAGRAGQPGSQPGSQSGAQSGAQSGTRPGDPASRPPHPGAARARADQAGSDAGRSAPTRPVRTNPAEDTMSSDVLRP